MSIKKYIKCILIFIFSFAFITNVKAGDVNIESVTLDYKSEDVSIVKEPVIDNLTIKFDIKVKKVGDFVKYKIIIDNKSNEDYEIKENNSLNTNKYISYLYSYDEQNNIAEMNKKTIMYITISYKNEVPNSELVDGYYNETSDLIIDLGENLENPDTGRVVEAFLVFIIIILIISLIIFKNKRNRRFIFVLFTSLLLIPTSIYAYGKIHFKVESKIEIEKSVCSSFETDSWEMISRNVINNNTECYNVGDTKEVELEGFGTHTVRIANKSNPTECYTSGFSQTACGFVIEFADIITNYGMNPHIQNGTVIGDGSNGGWEHSDMRNYVNNDIYNALPSDLKNIIINTTVVSGHGTEDNNNFITVDKLYLLDAKELYGSSFTYEYHTSKEYERQLDYYSQLGVTNSNSSAAIKEREDFIPSWWLRSPVSDSNYTFYIVYIYGSYSYIPSGSLTGVSPAFRIG